MVKDPICGMMVDQNSAFKLENAGQVYFFCSKHCLEKFAKENKLETELFATCSPVRKAPFYNNKIFIIGSAIALLLISSYHLSFLEPFRKSFLIYLGKIWWAILLGLFLGGVIDYYVPREYISHILAKPKKITILHSVILGFLMTVCSHGILAISIELHKKGASTPAVVSFLLASPWANFTLTIMLFGFFKAKAFFIILSAIVIAIITGFIYQILEKNGLIEKNKNSLEIHDGFSITSDIRKRFKEYKFSLEKVLNDLRGIIRGVFSLSDMVLWWILIGIIIASFTGAYLPSGIFNKYMGPSLLGLFVTLLVATIIEVCSEGSSPMAFEIYRQTGALGNSFVFLMAGVVTDYTEIGLLWHNVGRKTALWLPIITVPQVVLLGIIANRIF